jgi:hypothetical protein
MTSRYVAAIKVVRKLSSGTVGRALVEHHRQNGFAFLTRLWATLR